MAILTIPALRFFHLLDWDQASKGKLSSPHAHVFIAQKETTQRLINGGNPRSQVTHAHQIQV